MRPPLLPPSIPLAWLRWARVPLLSPVNLMRGTRRNPGNDPSLNGQRSRNAPTANSTRCVSSDSSNAADMLQEIDWMSLHPDPIAISVQLPDMSEKPEWKLNGSIITVPDLPLNTLFSTVRERIKRVVDADLPISRLRLDYGQKVMSNASTMASVNLDDGDMLVLTVRKK